MRELTINEVEQVNGAFGIPGAVIGGGLGGWFGAMGYVGSHAGGGGGGATFGGFMIATGTGIVGGAVAGGLPGIGGVLAGGAIGVAGATGSSIADNSGGGGGGGGGGNHKGKYVKKK
jgi:hypothetical protein